jgi:L-ascorbate metabolism protein UlaG (beta-lactamase superfamily)
MFDPTLVLSLALIAAPSASAESLQGPFREDVISTSAGDLTITFVGHGTLMFRYGGKVIHVDPVSREADYSRMPQADLILVTHEHGDHLDPAAVEVLRRRGTEVIVSPSCEGRVQRVTVMRNGETREVAGVRVEAVPAYNVVHKGAAVSRITPGATGTATSSRSGTFGST